MNKAANYNIEAESQRRRDGAAGSFLPDFCRHESLLPVMVIAELLAIVLAAVQPMRHWEEWISEFALISLFIQWVALCDVAVLCAMRKTLARLHNGTAAAIGFIVLQSVTLLVTLGMGWIVEFTGLALLLAQDWFGAQLRQNLIISAVVTAVALRYFHVQYQLRTRLAAEAEARVQALQARIRPHFLFNSMNTIASLTRIDAAKAEQAVQDLADLFRVSLADQDWLSLDQELELTRSYLRMEQLRLGSRLREEWHIDPHATGLRLPALSIQPLVENAVYHGIEQIPQGGLISIQVSAGPDHVLVAIENPLDPARAQRKGNQMAQDNVRQRLALAFGRADLLRVEDSAERYRVELRLPLSAPR